MGKEAPEPLVYRFGPQVDSLREGGLASGAVSEPETLPRLYPLGIHSEGSLVMTPGERGDKGGLHGMDQSHAKSGVTQGQMVHGASECRGGHYHCAGEGCSYVTRNKTNMSRHSKAKHNHAMKAEASSNAAGSSSATSSSTAAQSSSGNASTTDHGFGAMANIRRNIRKSSSYADGDSGC